VLAHGEAAELLARRQPSRAHPAVVKVAILVAAVRCVDEPIAKSGPTRPAEKKVAHNAVERPMPDGIGGRPARRHGWLELHVVAHGERLNGFADEGSQQYFKDNPR